MHHPAPVCGDKRDFTHYAVTGTICILIWATETGFGGDHDRSVHSERLKQKGFGKCCGFLSDLHRAGRNPSATTPQT